MLLLDEDAVLLFLVLLVRLLEPGLALVLVCFLAADLEFLLEILGVVRPLHDSFRDLGAYIAVETVLENARGILDPALGLAGQLLESSCMGFLPGVSGAPRTFLGAN